MRAHAYEVKKGNEVGPEFVGKSVTWNKAVTIGEALGLPEDLAKQISLLIQGREKPTGTLGSPVHFENEAALVAAAEQQRDIAVREDIRGELGKKDDAGKYVGSLLEAAKLANALTIGAPRSDGTVSKKAKPATQVNRNAQSAGNRIYERALVEPAWKQMMIDAGAIVVEEFNAWVAAREAATTAKAAPAAPDATPVEAPAAETPAEPVTEPAPARGRRPGGQK